MSRLGQRGMGEEKAAGWAAGPSLASEEIGPVPSPFVLVSRLHRNLNLSVVVIRRFSFWILLQKVMAFGDRVNGFPCRE